MIVLWVLLALLLLIMLLLLLPLRVSLRFEDEFYLTISYLFLRFYIFPSPEKPEDKQKSPSEKEGESTLDKLKAIIKRHGFLGFLQSFYELCQLLFTTGKRLLSKIKLSDFDLYLCVAGDDPAAGAELYGKLCGPIYAACAQLFAMTGAPRRKKPKKAVTVDLNYQAAENTVVFFAKLSVLPFTIVKEGLRLLWNALPLIRKFTAAPKKASHEKGEST